MPGLAARTSEAFGALHFEIEDVRGVDAKDVALGPLREERQRGDRRRQIEIPMRQSDA